MRRGTACVSYRFGMRLAGFFEVSFRTSMSIFLMFSDPMCKLCSNIFAFRQCQNAAIDGSSISFLLLYIATKRKVISGDLAQRCVGGSEALASSSLLPFQLLLLIIAHTANTSSQLAFATSLSARMYIFGALVGPQYHLVLLFH